jgi:predicted porin
VSVAAVLGVALASSAAMAQSSVTVFGQVSLALTKQTGTTTALDTTGFGSGIGFKGTEDLGNGLSAFFHLENRFDVDTGAAHTPFFDEKSVVGFTGNFGKVQFGRFGNALDDVDGLADPFGETVANMPHEAARGESKWNNAVGYYTPAMGPFSAALNVATKEPSTATTTTHAPYAVNLKYADGPAVVALGYARNASDDIKTTTLAGNYDFGMAKVYAGYTLSTNTGAGNARNGQIGVAVPVSAAGSVKAAFSSYKPDVDQTERENKFGLGYWHNLSKRTMLYVDAARTDFKLKSDVNAFDVGVFHKF